MSNLHSSRVKYPRRSLPLALLVVAACLSSSAVAFAEGFREAVLADYRLQETARQLDEAVSGPITPELDAPGGCDGVKNGNCGFHTAHEDQPWWQVDLGRLRTVDQVVVWNRCDGVAGRAAHLQVLFSEEGQDWRTVYTHDGTVFFGFKDEKPLAIALAGTETRFIRIQLPDKNYLHLDEVKVFGPRRPGKNLAFHRRATQSSVSQWSTRSDTRFVSLTNLSDEELESRYAARQGLLANPLLDFDALLFTKRIPGTFNHMSDQYFGWWSRPGGGIYLLRNYKSEHPTEECITTHFTEPGSFLRPDLSYDGKRVLFAWCRHYPGLKDEQNKLDKNNVPEDSFYHLFEMDIDGSNVRQITRGKYNDFDGRYLPDGRIVFLSTRRGHAIQVGRESAQETVRTADLPEAYVRCGGGPERPCAVYTLHTVHPDGTGLTAISPFEMFEWTPAVASDGAILYSRWDYIDRDNMPYMSLWSMNPDGTQARIVYGNYTHAPHCTFEPRSIPGSGKTIFTGSGHHAQTMGSLVLLDPAAGTEGDAPVTRLTPEVVFPEIEGWPHSYYANPWPLSEELYLVAWGAEQTPNQGSTRSANAMGIYLFDAGAGAKELLVRDPEFSCMYPIPVQSRAKPPVLASHVDWDGPQEGTFLVLDVYQGLKETRRGEVKALRVVAVPPKTHPTMNFPMLGLTRDDPGKCVLGTVPVEKDGSAHFRAPSGVILFLQALDARGMAVQTMRSATYVQPGQQVSCVGCHESRHQTPHSRTALAARRAPSPITPGPSGSWPLRFDTLVQPVLDRHCAGCHTPKGEATDVQTLDLSPGKAYEALVHYGKPSIYDHVMAAYRKGRSTEGRCTAAESRLLEMLTPRADHYGVRLSREDRERLVTWIDTYAQWQGSFSDEQERLLLELRERWAGLLAAR